MPVLEAQELALRYPDGTLANRRVSLALEPGEIHALAGENGAGKTTLVRLLFGLEQPTAGRLLLDGRPVRLRSPRDAISLGIGAVQQHFTLAPALTVAENILLGAEPARWGFRRRAAASALVRELAGRYGLPVEPDAPVAALGVGQRQRVEILKALARAPRVLILDEPTAVLTSREAAELFAALRRCAARDTAVLLISHRLPDVLAAADRVTVLRGGETRGSFPAAGVSAERLAALMLGQAPPALPQRQPPAVAPAAPPLLRLRGVWAGQGRERLRGLSLTLRPGEVLGVAGIEGSGQRPLAEALIGALPVAAGAIELAGRPLADRSPRASRQAGLALIAEDRLRDGVALAATLADNLLVTSGGRPPAAAGSRRGWWLRPAAANACAAALLAEYAIRPADPALPAAALSGGNLQKLVLARELAGAPKVIVAAQPTRGLDPGASAFIRRRLLERCQAGAALLLISADLDELLAMADRLLVLRDGAAVACFAAGSLPGEALLGRLMLGLERQPAAELEANQ